MPKNALFFEKIENKNRPALRAPRPQSLVSFQRLGLCPTLLPK